MQKTGPGPFDPAIFDPEIFDTRNRVDFHDGAAPRWRSLSRPARR